MKILLGKDVIDSLFSKSNSKIRNLLNNIVYNESLKISFSKTYIDLLDSNEDSGEFFKGLIQELYDTDRIVIEKCHLKPKPNEEFELLALSCNDSFFIPIIVNDDPAFKNVKSLLVLNGLKKNEKAWIIKELLSKSIYNVSYQDFLADNEIENFFSNLFCVYNFLKEVVIFDREINSSLLSTIKGVNVKYYTYSKRGKQYDVDRQTAKNNLKKELGGKLKLFYTNDLRILHERKIIIENLIITIDNSRSNLTIKEPTWEITVTIDEEKASRWKSKTRSFTEVTSF